VQGTTAFINPSTGLFQMPGAVDALMSTTQSTQYNATVSTTATVFATPSSTITLNAAVSGLSAVSGSNTTLQVGGQVFIVTAVNGAAFTVTGNASSVATSGAAVIISQASATSSVPNSFGSGAWSAFDPTGANSTSITPATGVNGSAVSDAGTFVLAETALDMHCWGQNPVVTAKLQLNGQDRFSEREGSYFDVVQPFQHHTRAPDTGINVYSFALRPEEHQPSGTCNFSRIDNAVLQLVLSSPTVSGTNTAKVRVYAVNYNVLRVMSGMAGVAYSN
jgi:hypothetical protein